MCIALVIFNGGMDGSPHKTLFAFDLCDPRPFAGDFGASSP